MIGAFKSELRKIYSVRSTYAILLFSLVLMLIFAFWIEGIKAGANGAPVTSPTKLSNLALDAVTNLAFWGALVGILSMTHEYRYNTITYTLTAARRRTQALFAKVGAVSVFALLFTVFVGFASVGLMYLGLSIKGFSLAHQEIHSDLIWRILFEGWAYAMLGLLIACIIRIQVGAIAALFVLNAVVEPLIGVLLKDNQAYLPFSALQQVTKYQNGHLQHTLSHGRAALTVGIYLIIGWLVAWLLFLRRDAS
jgi:ABC-2 type transport system permease protein